MMSHTVHSSRLMVLIGFILIAWAPACGGPAPVADQAGESVPVGSDRIYTLDAMSGLGWKQKGGFERAFMPATDAAWGFLDGREVAVLVYASPADARQHGLAAGAEQTEVTPEGTFGPNVERTKCAGFGNYRTPYKLDVSSGHCGIATLTERGPGSSEKCALAAAEGTGGAARESGEAASQPVCPQRVPTYSEFAIEGNLVLLCEAKPSDGKAECSVIAERLRR